MGIMDTNGEDVIKIMQLTDDVLTHYKNVQDAINKINTKNEAEEVVSELQGLVNNWKKTYFPFPLKETAKSFGISSVVGATLPVIKHGLNLSVKLATDSLASGFTFGMFAATGTLVYKNSQMDKQHSEKKVLQFFCSLLDVANKKFTELTASLIEAEKDNKTSMMRKR